MSDERGGLPLHARQAAVVDHAAVNKVTVVTASAGSGKTYTVLATVLHLVGSGLVEMDSIALITFTNAAADELRQRLHRELEARADRDGSWYLHLERASLCFVGTIHSYCHELLTRYAYSGTHARASAPTASRRYLKMAVRDVLERRLATDGHLTQFAVPQHDLEKRLQEVAETVRNRGDDLEQLLTDTGRQGDDAGRPYRLALAGALAEIHAAHKQLKAEHLVLDSQDLLQAAAEVLESSEGEYAAGGFAARWPLLFIDEFQDTDRTQKRIVDRLVSHLQKLVVVGDRKQSIYGFRGADVSLLEHLANEQTGAQPLSLAVARRPTRELLAAQNRLFTSIRDRYPRLDEPAQTGTAPAPHALAPFVYLTANRSQDGPPIAKRVLGLMGQPLPGTDKRIGPGDCVLLVRANWQVDHYVRELSALLQPDGVPVVAEAGESYYQRPAVVATYRVLNAVLNHRHDPALSAALGTPYFHEVDPAEMEAWILQYAPGEGSPLTDWLEGKHPNDAQRLAGLRRALRTDTAPQFLSRLFDGFDIRAYYRGLDDSSAVEDLERLREQARKLFRNEEALTVRAFTDWLLIAIRENFPLDVDEAAVEAPRAIRVMTVHRAKGRGFPVVVIPGMDRSLHGEQKDPWFFADEDGLDVRLDVPDGVVTETERFPAKLQANRRAALDEEMRLLYVAITRAQHQVIFAGGGMGRTLNPPENKYYSWSDEVLRVYSTIPGAI